MAMDSLTLSTREFPTFDAREIVIGRELGRGSFCTVYEVQSIRLPQQQRNISDHASNLSTQQIQRKYNVAQSGTESVGSASNDSSSYHDFDTDIMKVSNTLTESSLKCIQDRNLRGSVVYDSQYKTDGTFDMGHARTIMSKYYLREDQPRYAVKRYKLAIKSEYKKKLEASERNEKQLSQHETLIELHTEVIFLSQLSHPNIIKMRGYSSLDSKHFDFFAILDRLFETLSERINGKWTKRYNETKSKLFGGEKDKTKRNHFWSERLLTLYDLSSAFRYLHERRIIYRDIKPENVGFDIRGDIKLFDFGLARFLPKKTANENDRFLMTPCAGTCRYMAPEVGLGNGYNLSADVFGFGILIWEVAALATPFEKMNMNELEHAVWKRGTRPKVHKSWPAPLISLIQRCWSVELNTRPSFKIIAQSLQNLAYEMEGSQEVMSRSSHMKAKSEKSWADKESNHSSV